jgi:hypothetical protein
MKQSTPFKLIPCALLVAALFACTPDGADVENEDTGSAAPDVTSETSPPPVPPAPDDTTGLVDNAPRTP